MEVTGFRKLGMAVLIILVAVGIVALKGDISTNMIALLLGVFTAYTTGNVVSKAIGGGEAPPAAASTESKPDPYLPILESITIQGNAIRNGIAVAQQGVGQILAQTQTIISKAGFDKSE